MANSNAAYATMVAVLLEVYRSRLTPKNVPMAETGISIARPMPAQNAGRRERIATCRNIQVRNTIVNEVKKTSAQAIRA